MIQVERFGDIMKPLLKRFKKLSADQLEIYFDILKHYDEEILKAVIQTFSEEADFFPNPGKIKLACINARHNRIKSSSDSPDHIRSSCIRCRNGLVTVTYQSPRRDGTLEQKWRSFHCAVCNPNPCTSPQAVQINDQVFLASRISPKDPGCYIPDLQNKAILEGAVPIISSKSLEEYYCEDKAGRDQTTPKGSSLDTLNAKVRDIVGMKVLNHERIA